MTVAHPPLRTGALNPTSLELALRERQQITAFCANCTWSVTGSLAETRAAFRGHRLAAHPEIVETMPNPRANALQRGQIREMYADRVEQLAA